MAQRFIRQGREVGMMLTVEIPDNAKNVAVEVLCDGKRYCCNDRYRPGFWNGLNGGTNYGQYFDMEDENRVREMVEVASVLNEHGIKYQLSKLKRQYRIMITERDYLHMDAIARETILDINMHHKRLASK